MEQKINIKLKERQEIFNQVFQQDMQQYIISGIIPVMKSSSEYNIKTFRIKQCQIILRLKWLFTGNCGRDEVSLEDIEIEDDTDALNELLNSWRFVLHLDVIA